MEGIMGVGQRQEDREKKEENSLSLQLPFPGEDNLIFRNQTVNFLDNLSPSFLKSISEIIKVFN